MPAFKIAKWVFILSTVFTIIIPSEKTIYLMLGAHGVEKLAESEIGNKVYTILNQKLDEYLKESVKK